MKKVDFSLKTNSLKDLIDTYGYSGTKEHIIDYYSEKCKQHYELGFYDGINCKKLSKKSLKFK